MQQVLDGYSREEESRLARGGVPYLSWRELDRSWCYRPAAPEASAAAGNLRKAGPAGHNGQSASAPLRHTSRCTAGEGTGSSQEAALPDVTTAGRESSVPWDISKVPVDETGLVQSRAHEPTEPLL